MSSRAVIALGIGQCVNWGVLYYAFAVCCCRFEAELGAERWIVTGAALAPGSTQQSRQQDARPATRTRLPDSAGRSRSESSSCGSSQHVEKCRART